MPTPLSPFPYPLHDRARATAQGGFALVIALSLMAFIVLLVLSLSTLLQVETSSSKIQLSTLEARQNARLAGVVALGELQKTMGPDTRVSARAEMLSSNTPGASGEADETTRFWTGVWNSKQVWLGSGSPEDARPADARPYRPYKGNREEFVDDDGSTVRRFTSWLVSMPDEDRAQIDTPRDPITAQNVIDNVAATVANIQAPPAGGGNPVTTPVRVPLLDVGENGSFGWWVSDEGVKANIGLTNPMRNTPANSVNGIPAYLFPHRENFSGTNWFGGTDFDSPNLVEKLRKLSNASRYPWLAFQDASVSSEAQEAMTDNPSNTSGDSLFADYTLHTHGVISNNKTGGLRRDLSLAFWRDRNEMISLTGGRPNAGFNADFSDRENLFGRIFNKEDYPERTARATLSRDFFGPQWDTLRDYHNSFQKLEAPQIANATAYIDSIRVNLPNNFNARWVFGGPEAELDSLDRVGSRNSPGDLLRARSRSVAFMNNPTHPVILGLNIEFWADVVETAASTVDSPSYEPRLKIISIVTLWNPYNVAIQPTTSDGVNTEAWRLSAFLGEFEFGFTNDNGSKRLSTLFENKIFRGRGLIFSFINSGDNLLLQPGEVRQYRLVPGGSGELSPDFSENAIVFTADDLDFNSSYSEDETVTATMTVPDKYTSGSAGVQGGVRFDFAKGDVGLGHPTLQMIRFDQFDEQVPDAIYSDFASAGSLHDDTTSGDGSTNGEGLFMAGLEFYLKSADEPGVDSGGMLANFNPRAPFPGGALITSYTGNQAPNYLARILAEPSSPFPGDPSGDLVRGFWGQSRTAGNSFVTLFDVPRRPPESLGQYQHAALSLFGSQPAYAFGNSYAHPHVNRSFAHDAPGGTSQIDLSWFLNDAIWDEYFLSTINVDIDPSTPQRERFLQLETNRSFVVSNPEHYKEVASNLLLRGAFNVNSTSVEAWIAFLSALGGDSPSGSLNLPYHRLSATTETPNNQWTGGPRDLTSAEIRRLAEIMVDEVKARGPFLSLSDFVNRRLESGDSGEMGAIQAAIQAANINNVVPFTSGDLGGAPYSGNLPNKAGAIAPGDISQADVLTTIGPKMSARSDTFVIRSYGRTTGTISGEIESEAWCEMLVQRFPSDALSDDLGRPFKVLSFRYLNEDEI